MSDPDLSAFETARNQKVACGIFRLNLTPEQRAQLDAVFARGQEYTVAGIVRVLRDDWGFEIGKNSVEAHRGRRCACARAAKPK